MKRRARYTLEYKLEAARRVKGGQVAAVTAKILGIPKQTLENWVRLHGKGQLKGAVDKPVSPAQMAQAKLRAENARRRMERDILGKSYGVLRSGIKLKYAWIASNIKHWPTSLAREMLGVSTSGYFEHMRRKGANKPSKPGANNRISNEALLAHVRAIHTEVKQEYGWPKMWKELVARGIRVGKERV